MATQSYSASYSNCLHNFVITGLPASRADDKLLHSFTCVIRNILSRSSSIKPSAYLLNALGGMPENEPPLALVNKDAPLPRWENTIKGAENGYNPAREFFYSDELWHEYFSGYEWVRQLMIPEAPLGEILDSDLYRKSEQAADFYLPAARLVIEIDGVQHKEPGSGLKDYRRDEELKRAGIRVVRINVSDYRDRTLTFEDRLREILTALEESEEIRIIQQQTNSKETKKRLLYENILRYEFLILELIARGQLHINQKNWLFQVPENGQRFVLLACKDLFLYYKNLYQLKGMSVEMPNVTFTDEPGSIKLQNFLFSRPDERKVSCPTVLTSAWDGKDYFKVSCGKPVDYEIPWPIPDTGDRGTALKFFLNELFGYTEFKNGQWQIISNILLLRRTIGILPTGGGKSLCYQLAAMLQPGITMVICPINSLQIDQKRNLDEAGIVHTDYIASVQDTTTKAGILNKLENGREQFVWISPERFQSRAFRRSISKISKEQTISYNVIDEVHCLSEWGHDFRTSYLTLISSLEKTCPNTTIIGLTATASQAVLEDLKAEFGIDGSSIRSLPSLERSNLTFRVLKTTEQGKNENLDHILRHHDYGKSNSIPETGLVFTLTRDQSDNPASRAKNKLKRTLSTAFPENAEQIGRFHSDAPDKVEVQDKFLGGELRLLSTTKAFGMGVNKRDLRFTVHYSLPWSTESFYQEAGRAGRDDEPAECTILFAPDQFGQQDAINKVFDQTTSSEDIKQLVDQNKLKGDLSTIFYLWGGNNKGVYTDVKMIGMLMNRINETPPQLDSDNNRYYCTVFSDFRDNEDEKLPHPRRLTKERLELALYRLKLLGVVDDWLIDWSTKPTSFDVYLDEKKSTSYVRQSLIRYFQKRLEPKNPAEFIDQQLTNMTPLDFPELEIEKGSFVEYILRYAQILIQWTYDHIAYSRRQATYRIYDFCRNYTDPISFRESIDRFLRITEQSITLDGIIHNQDNYRLWFRAFYNENVSEEWETSEQFLDPSGMLQLRLSSARYRESYRDITGLNFVYVLSGFFTENADLELEPQLLIECFDRINQMDPEDREDIWERICILVDHYRGNLSDKMKEGLGYCLASGFPDKARDIYQLLEDPHSLAIIIQEYTKKIQQAAAGFRR